MPDPKFSLENYLYSLINLLVMHETIIANNLINEARKHGKVKEVTIEIGDLANMPAEELEETLKKMADFKVNIIKKKAKVECKCGYTGQPNIIEKGHDFNLFVCPKCEDIPAIVEGDKIILKEVKV